MPEAVSYVVVTPFNTVGRRFAEGELIEEDEDLGGAAIEDVLGFLQFVPDDDPAPPEAPPSP